MVGRQSPKLMFPYVGRVETVGVFALMVHTAIPSLSVIEIWLASNQILRTDNKTAVAGHSRSATTQNCPYCFFGRFNILLPRSTTFCWGKTYWNWWEPHTRLFLPTVNLTFLLSVVDITRSFLTMLRASNPQTF
jgi:hypothetical protein